MGEKAGSKEFDSKLYPSEYLSVTPTSGPNDPYYPHTSIFIVVINPDSNKLREFLHAKIAKRKKQIHPEHSARFNHDMQLQIDCFEWVLEKIEVNKISNDRLDGHIRSMIKNLEKRKDKAMIRSDTDDLWTKIETLQWVLYVIFAVKNERMVVI
jgi:hypothetical protein